MVMLSGILQFAVVHQADLQPSQLLGARIDAEREAFALQPPFGRYYRLDVPVVLGERLGSPTATRPGSPGLFIDCAPNVDPSLSRHWRGLRGCVRRRSTSSRP